MPVKNHPQIDVSLLVRLWVEILSVLLYVYKVNVSLLVRLWVEMSITDCNDALDYGQPPCEAVSWNITAAILSPTALGQPPCEAVSWNEQLKDSIQKVTSSASLWGCELKCVCVSSSECFFQSASLWGCELKCTVRSGAENCLIVSLLVRLWVEIGVCITAKNVCYVSLLVRLWVEIQLSSKHLKFAWVSLLVRLWVEIPYWSGWNDNVLVSLLVRLWVEIRNRKRPTSQMWSASLWGCELKCRVPRIWLFHCNRQIILRSGIKSLQPFERWSNLLQVTCDLW